ncbi:MAG: putative manganese-dependent inorganic diphosphatase [Thermoleophilia bacterium]|nr:putative manganese-dependent inorganic diphosphatase [Thermoleophilia bacterium]
MASTPTKKRNVYVIGHATPDTDSVCSAIGYALFKNLTDKRFVFTPARAGSINEETKFVLDRFGVPVPIEVESLTPTVSDLELHKPIAIYERDSVHALAQLVREEGVRTVPVVDDTGRVLGILGLRDIAQFHMASAGLMDLSNAPISLDIFIKTLDGRMITNAGKADTLKGRVIIASMQRGTLLNTMHEGDIVVLGDQQDLQLDCLHAGCSTLIITDGISVAAEVIRKAEELGVLIVSSPHPAFASVQLLLMSEPVSSIMDIKPATVGLFTPISDLRKAVLDSDYRSAVVADSDDRLIGFVTRTDLLDPVRKRAILVDHNEISHAVDGIEEAEILEIIDHHRVGDVSTAAPIYVYNDPLGSTCTIVADMMFLHQVHVPAEIAGILLSGILSDTLMLTLSTTTERDQEIAERLASLAGVSIDDYGLELMHASINVGNKTAAELIAADFRKVDIGGKKLGIGQMMVLDCTEIDVREVELLAELDRLRKEDGYDLTVMLVTNPLNAEFERVLASGETWIIEKAFNCEIKNGTCRIPGVMSRKKDFIPAVGRVLFTA